MTKSARFESAVWAIVIAASAALIGAAALGFAALAQQAQTTSIATDDLFQPNTQNFKPGAGERLVNFVKQAQMPGSQCPIDVDFTVFDSSSDPLWSQTMAGTRREAIERVLRGLGPSVRVTAKSTNGIISAVIISTQTATDKERPKLDTNSVPRKGSKVKAGDKITVTMVARDNANLWQTGIKTVQLVADSEEGRFIEVRNYLPSPGCLAPPMERRVVATYTVPQTPPLIVRLGALAEDHVGLTDTDVGEFPTQGDWYGRIEWSAHSPEDTTRRPNENRAETKFGGQADLSLNYDGRGNLSGTLRGSWQVDTMWWGFPHGDGRMCKGSSPPTPVSADIVGSYTPGPEAVTLQPLNMVANIVVPQASSGPSPRLICSDMMIDQGATLSALLRAPLQRAPDGTYHAELNSSNPEHDFRYSLKLRRAGN